MMKHSFATFTLLAGLSFFCLPSNSFAQSDSLAPSNDLATGHSYYGIDLGATGTDYLGSHNFQWGMVTLVNSTYNKPQFATYLPFTGLGTGVGFLGGLKAGVALAPWMDLEAKFRFMTNYASRTESSPDIELDPFVPAVQSPATSTYSLMLSSIGGALLGHIRLNDWLYAAAGASASSLLKNGFSASQTVSTGYIDLITHSKTTIVSQTQPQEQISNWFYSFRGDVQVGVGGVYRLGANNMMLDFELLAGIPLTQWLTPLADSSLYIIDTTWHQPRNVDPHLWYVTLTVGLRLPFTKLPPPIPPPLVISNVPPVEITQATPKLGNRTGLQLQGTVTDALTGKPLNATLTAVDLANNKVIATSQTDSNGNYSLPVPGMGRYSVTATAPGHLFGTALFEVDSEGRILTNPTSISLEPSASGAKTRLLVFFEFDKSDLQPASMPELNRALDLMKQVPTMKVQIAGYTDSVGTLAHNMELSGRRADAVREYLIQMGIAPDRIRAQGYGPESPIDSNGTDEGRAKNRRVEFVVEAQ